MALTDPPSPLLFQKNFLVADSFVIVLMEYHIKYSSCIQII